ncbi:hypothetical protein BK708_25250 [Bacillus thuringiensis serovar yunnanensis]|nr:hypothetical protein BK708_25250 [Bacillus thuringiensis serovar yunnanensis]
MKLVKLKKDTKRWLSSYEYRFVSSNHYEINEEFGFAPVDSDSKKAVLQRAIDMASAIAKKYCEKPVTQ